jgi:hypothetical protein
MAAIKRCLTGNLISEYLDCELDEDASRHIEEHLACCGTCNAAYLSMKATHTLLLEHSAVADPSTSIKEKLFERLGEPRGIAWDRMRYIFRLFPFESKAWAFALIFIFFLAVTISALNFRRYFDDKRTLAELDRIKAEWTLRDLSRNPFDLNGVRLQFNTGNPFKSYLGER